MPMDQTQLRSAIDAVKTAILTEMQGYELYKGAAERTTDPEARRMFQLLAQEEETHNQMLHEQFQSLLKQRKFVAPLDGEHGEGFETLIADEQWRRSLQFGTMELSVVSIGASLEARAIALYKKCAEETADAEGRKVFEWLVRWEEDHLRWMQWLEEDLKQRFWAEQGFSPM
jgi:rubrerythrin